MSGSLIIIRHTVTCVRYMYHSWAPINLPGNVTHCLFHELKETEALSSRLAHIPVEYTNPVGCFVFERH